MNVEFIDWLWSSKGIDRDDLWELDISELEKIFEEFGDHVKDISYLNIISQDINWS